MTSNILIKRKRKNKTTKNLPLPFVVTFSYCFLFVYLGYLINAVDVAAPLINNIPSWRQIN